MSRCTSRVASIALEGVGKLFQMACVAIKPVHLLSSGIQTTDSTCLRRVRGQSNKITLNTLYPYIMYTKYMGGVDLNIF